MAGMTMTARGATAGLPERLRVETAPCHKNVEAVADIPGRIHSRDDYVEFLGVLGQLHMGLEAHLCAPSWSREWLAVGVTAGDHCRADLLVDDLDGLGVLAPAFPELPSFPNFGQVLGCLYVLEGSALGGRIVAGLVVAAIGPVPTAFLTGRGRTRQWPAVRNALRRFDAQGGDGDAVVAGAVSTFELFARSLAAPVLQR